MEYIFDYYQAYITNSFSFVFSQFYNLFLVLKFKTYFFFDDFFVW